MSLLVNLINAEINDLKEEFDAKTLTRPALLLSDGLNKSYAVDLDIGQKNPLRNVPIASGSKDVYYAEVGSAVRVRRSPSGWFEVTGLSKRMPGTLIEIPVSIPRFAFSPQVVYGGVPPRAATGGVVVGSAAQVGITSRILTYAELATYGGYGNLPYGATAFYSNGAYAGTDLSTVSVPTAPAPVTEVLPVVSASGGTLAAVQAAVDSAAVNSVVDIPAGTFDWGSGQLLVPAGIHLRGAGKGVTIIKRNGPVANNVYLIKVDGSNGRRVIISGMTLEGNYDPAIDDNGLGLVNTCIDFLVYDVRFLHFAFAGADVRGDPSRQRGLLFRCDFDDNYAPGRGNLGYGVSVYGNGTWPSLALGAADAVFVEDCNFSGNRHNIAANDGARYVFRYNKVTGTDAVKDWAMTDAHGLSSAPHGTRSYEIYNNTYAATLSSGMMRAAVGIRGGDGVIFGNSASSNIARLIELDVEGFTCGSYPGPDQIHELNIWGNSGASPATDGSGVANNCASSISLGRDYFLNARAGYTPYTYPHPLRPASVSTAPSTPPATVSRDILKWPFSPDSIWNMPIGSGAVYVDSGLSDTFYSSNTTNNTWAPMPMVDPEIMVFAPTAPVIEVKYSGVGWSGGDRCIPTGATLLSVPVPNDYTVPSNNQNGCAAILDTDGRTIQQMQPFTRCTPGGSATSIIKFAAVDLYGTGISGAHGGSGLSAIGGSIRLGELRPGQIGMRHALKVNVYAADALYNGATNADCFRWPATKADSYAASTYGTNNNNSNTAMKMGALLAIPASVNLSGMGLETEPAQQLAWTLQNYGAYIVDDIGSSGFSLTAEVGPQGSKLDEFAADWGFSMEQRRNTDIAWVRDMRKLILALKVVDNNRVDNIGGGGTPLQPLAPSVTP